MKNIRIDNDGNPRCWNCGSKGLTEKRTLRSKASLGVGAMLTKKKLKCQRCGEYNDTGSGEPYDGPKARKYRKEWTAEQAASSTTAGDAESSVSEKLAQLAELHAAGSLTDAEFAAAKAQLLA
jgi:DNA-directed RNA polymerase subunit RPC12/RpoP